MKFIWICPLIGSVIGSLILIDGLLEAKGAPQQAAAAAMGCAFAVLPYCVARAIQELSLKKTLADVHEQQAIQTRLLAALANKAAMDEIPKQGLA